jgi:preprotein translocase subunit SecE
MAAERSFRATSPRATLNPRFKSPVPDPSTARFGDSEEVERPAGFEERAVVNRQYKREMKKQEGKKRAPSPRPAAAQQKRQRTRPRQFAKEVIAELQKVNWPSRSEVVSYSTVVLVAAVALAVVIAGMDYVFTKGVLVLFGVD